MANRGLSAGAITVLGSSTFEMYHLLSFDFSTPVYLTDAPYDITYGGNVYLSDAMLLSIPSITESLKIKPETINIGLSSANYLNFVLLLSEAKNAETIIYKYLPNIPEAIVSFKGYKDS